MCRQLCRQFICIAGVFYQNYFRYTQAEPRKEILFSFSLPPFFFFNSIWIDVRTFQGIRFPILYFLTVRIWNSSFLQPFSIVSVSSHHVNSKVILPFKIAFPPLADTSWWSFISVKSPHPMISWKSLFSLVLSSYEKDLILHEFFSVTCGIIKL